jgi:hypothetical protein
MTTKNVFISNAELDFPKVLPSLDLDFVNSNVLDQRVDFTRASGGSYVGPDGLIKYVGINQPRFDYDPETGECLGLLMEEARTNLINQSEDFNTWVLFEPSTITRKLSDVKSPDGASNYFLCTYGSNDLRRAFSGGFGRTYTASCFFKQPFEGNFSDLAAFEMHIIGGATSKGRVTYRFSTNRIIRSQGENLNAPIRTGFKKYADGSVRLWLTMTDNGSGTSVFFLNLRGGNTAGNTGKSILTWGAQIEEGEFPTSYIPTRGSARTRAADNFSMIGKNFDSWFRKDEGTIFVAHKALTQLNFRGSSTNSIVYGIIQTTDFITSTLSIFYNTRSDNDDIFVFGRVSSDTVNEDVIRFQQAQPSRKKAIFSYNGPKERYQPYVDGVKITTVIRKNPYIELPYRRLDLARPVSGVKFNGHYQRFTYYPKSLPDSQLQFLTL